MLSCGENIAKIRPVSPEIFNKICLFFWPCRTWCSQMSSIIFGVTRQKFTTFSHDIATSSSLLTRTFRQWYCTSFSNDSANNAIFGVHDILPKSIDCHGNVPRQIGKQGTDLSSALKALSYGVKIVKIGPVFPEIFDEICQFFAMS